MKQCSAIPSLADQCSGNCICPHHHACSTLSPCTLLWKRTRQEGWGTANLLLKEIAFLHASVAHWKGLSLPKLSLKLYVKVQQRRNGSGVAKAFVLAPMEQRPSPCRDWIKRHTIFLLGVSFSTSTLERARTGVTHLSRWP